MAAEVHSVIHDFKQAFAIRNILNELTGKTVHIGTFVDRKTLFHLVVKMKWKPKNDC